MVGLKVHDVALMALLRQNCRATMRELSSRLRAPISTVYDRMISLNESLITRHTAIIDFSKLGFSTRVSLIVHCAKNRRTEVQEFLQRQWSVNTLYVLNSSSDLFVECIFRDLKGSSEFIGTLTDRFGSKVDIHYITDDLKREAFLSDPETASMIAKESPLVEEIRCRSAVRQFEE